MGADVCGVDFSEKAIHVARQTADELGLNARFVCCNVFDLKQHLDDTFDIVFASYGVIGWHPDLKPWAELVAHFVRPGGMHLIAEFHPVVWIWSDDFSHVQYSYFNNEEISEIESGTYAETSADIKSRFVSWNHSIEESLNGLINAGLTIKSFKEYDTSPYDCFENVIKTSGGYQIKGMQGKLPMVFSIVAEKPE